VTSVTNPLGQFAYQYVDETARVRSLAYPNGQITNFSYYPNASTDNSGDDDQRLLSIQNLSPSGANISTFAYTYDSDGEITTWGKQWGSGSNLQSIFSYDAASQLLSATGPNPTTQAMQGFFYAYDGAGNRTQEQIDASINTSIFNSTNEYASEAAGGSMTFEGTVSEPATVTVGGNPATVDSLDNWIGAAAVTAGTNLIPLTAVATGGSSISKNINVTTSGGPSRTLTYDSNGNLTNNGAGQTYKWDAENRLVGIVQASGTTGFVYDGAGHRLQETLNGTVIKQWVWCGSQTCEERNASGTVTKRFYAQGEQIGGAAYYFTRDHLGSVREMTDASGNVQAQYDYDPYGRVTQLAGSMTADFGFTGDYYHAASGLSLTIFRAYDPNLGRWVSRDRLPSAESIEGPNLYSYVDNNPVVLVDIWGLCTQADCDQARKLAAAVTQTINDLTAGIGLGWGLVQFGQYQSSGLILGNMGQGATPWASANLTPAMANLITSTENSPTLIAQRSAITVGGFMWAAAGNAATLRFLWNSSGADADITLPGIYSERLAHQALLDKLNAFIADCDANGY
jgi:RHS repeat-associated protein